MPLSIFRSVVTSSLPLTFCSEDYIDSANGSFEFFNMCIEVCGTREELVEQVRERPSLNSGTNFGSLLYFPSNFTYCKFRISRFFSFFSFLFFIWPEFIFLISASSPLNSIVHFMKRKSLTHNITNTA